MRRGWRWIKRRAAGRIRPAQPADGGLTSVLSVMNGTAALTAALSAVNAAAAQGRVMWLSLLAFGTYLFVVVGGTTHRDLLLEGPVKLPILSTELPLFTFYWAAPVLFILFHLYMLLKLGVIAGKLALFEDALAVELARIGNPDKRAALEARWRGQLDAFLYLQMRAAPAGNGVQRALVRATIWVTLVIGPVLLLLAFQIRFLPYHHEGMTWAHRGFLVIDLTLLILLWPPAAGGRGAKRWLPVSAFAALAFPFSLIIATIPGETASWGLQAKNDAPWRPTAVLFEGEWDDAKRTVRSPFSRNLALQEEVLVDRDRLDKVETTLSLRGRDLRYANFVGADLRKADLYRANMRGTNLEWGQLQGANLSSAQLQGANLSVAQLQGANLSVAQLQGANLSGAQLQGASLLMAKLQGANLWTAQLQGASLWFAKLQVANLGNAELQGADLLGAELQGTDLRGAQLQGAFLKNAVLWRSDSSKADLTLADLKDLRFEAMYPNEIEELKKDVSDAIAVTKPDRDETLERLAVLTETWDDQREAASRETWRRNASAQLPEAEYNSKLAEFTAKLACDAENAPFVARGVAQTFQTRQIHTVIVIDFGRLKLPSSGASFQGITPGLAKALLDPGCLGAKGLSEDERTELRRIVDKATAKP